MKAAFDRTFKISICLQFIDLIIFNVIFFLNMIFDHYLFPNCFGCFLDNLLASNAAYIIALQFVSISLHHRMSQPARVLRNTSRTSFIFILLYMTILGIFGRPTPNIISLILMGTTIFIATTITRLCIRRHIHTKRALGHDRVNTVILGCGQMMQMAVDIMTNPFNGYNIIGFFDNKEHDVLINKETGQLIDRLGKFEDVIKYIHEHKIDELYIGISPSEINWLKELVTLCDKKIIRIYYVPDVMYKEFKNSRIKEFGDIYILQQYNEPLYDLRNRITKRIFDICFSLVFLCTLFPIVLIIVAIISKITMPGPLFFKQKRTGYDGKDFNCYKFRSMKINKEADTLQAFENDPRITKWGHFIRHTNIDELPQFINVLKGDMSIVGPRPHMLAHTDYYSNLISDYMIRHYVKPGITGWAQTHGERGETKTVDDMKRRIERDIWYIEHWSFWLDIQIIGKTALDMICGDKKAF
ncbi:MAG: undecaprenyl-phosphate glucose phosphotransferase [Prevotella sp.]